MGPFWRLNVVGKGLFWGEGAGPRLGAGTPPAGSWPDPGSGPEEAPLGARIGRSPPGRPGAAPGARGARRAGPAGPAGPVPGDRVLGPPGGAWAWRGLLGQVGGSPRGSPGGLLNRAGARMGGLRHHGAALVGEPPHPPWAVHRSDASSYGVREARGRERGLGGPRPDEREDLRAHGRARCPVGGMASAPRDMSDVSPADSRSTMRASAQTSLGCRPTARG